MQTNMSDIVKFANLQDRIIELRGQSVLLDADVADIYGVETKRINEAVKNNTDKFPVGYIIELDKTEWDGLNRTVAFLYGYAQGVARFIRKPPFAEEFVKKEDSNLIIYGFRGKSFFEKQYSDLKRFSATWERMRGGAGPIRANPRSINGKLEIGIVCTKLA
jgi:hypothetical protein